MLHAFRVVAAASMGLLLSGCAEWSSIQYEFDPGTNKVATIDAKQRVVSMQSIARKNGAEMDKRLAVCVEQSPDVFALLSGSMGVSAETKAVAASLAAAIAESGGSLAFRTQVTQAQANLLYTICQMNVNGSLSDRAARVELRRFQHMLVGMLAIEQLTSPGRQSATHQLLTTSTATVGQNVSLAQDKVAAAEKAVAKAKDAKTTADKQVEATKPKDDKPSAEHTAALEAQKTAAKDVADAQDKLDLATKELTAARLALSAVAGGAQPSVINVYAQSNGVSDKVAEMVVQALDTVIQRGALLDNCSEAMFENESNYAGVNDPTLGKVCGDAFKAYTDAYTKHSQAVLLDSQTQNLIIDEATKLYRAGKISSEDFKAILMRETVRPATPRASATTGPHVLGQPGVRLNLPPTD